MANIVNQYGQVKVGVRTQLTPPPSSLWTNVYSVYNADATGSSSLKTSLVAAYNGESNANDSFGSNNGTAVGGLTYTTGKIGNAFDFNGTNSYISIPNTSGQLNFTGDFSISTWVMPLVTSAGYVLYFSNFLSSGSGYNFYLDRTNNTLQLYMAGGGNYSRYEYSWTPLVNTWYHLVLTRKGSTGTKFYINGTEAVGTYSGLGATFNPSFQSGQIYNIGSTLNGSGLANYRQDATTIWQKELSASEITELYNSGNGAQYITDNFYKPTTNDALNTYNGTAQGGLTYGVGKVGTAFQFNGTNSYVSLPNNSLNPSGDFTISLWVKFNSVAATYINLIENYYAPFPSNRYGYNMYLQSGKIRFATYNVSITNSAQSTTTFVANQWYQIVLSKKLNTAPKLYVNGLNETFTQVGGNISNNIVYNSLCKSLLGVDYDTSYNSFLNGSLDAINVWNRELTATEITELYNSGNGKQYTI